MTALYNRPTPRYDSRTAERSAYGLGGPTRAAMSREQSCLAAFLSSGVPLWADRTGSRQGSPVLSRSANPFGSAHPAWRRGKRFVNRTERANNMTTLIQVAFQGATLLVVEHQAQPYVPMRAVVEGIGLTWQAQHTKLISNPRWGTTEIVTVAEDGKQREMTCLPLRKLPGWLQTISPNKVRNDLRAKVIAYQDQCDDILWQAWQKSTGTEPPKALPPQPPELLTPNLRALIDRKANQTAVAQYAAIHDLIRNYVEDNRRCGCSESDAERYIEQIGNAASHMTLVMRTDIEALALRTITLLNAAGDALEIIDRMEKHLGRELYLRTRDDKILKNIPEQLVEYVLRRVKERT